MAVVTLLGIREIITLLSKPSSTLTAAISRIQLKAPAQTPASTAFRLFLSTWNCWYIGTARLMVAGVISQKISFVPEV